LGDRSSAARGPVSSSLDERSGITPGTQKWFTLSAVSVGTFMATLDGSIVNIALPKIQTAFNVELATIEWIVVAYLLTVGTLLLPFGRLGEIVGFRRVYVAGFALFTVASALCGASPNVWALVGFRIIQGIGAAMLQSMGPAIVTRTFGWRERGKALGLNAISVSIGLSLGPALGGLLTEWGSCRWIFYINVPVGIFAIIWALRVVPLEVPGLRQRFDIPGGVLSFAALFSLLLGLVEGDGWGWSSPAVIGLLVGSVVLGALFVLRELHAPEPLLDLRLFSIRAFSAGNASLLVVFAALFIATFLMPFFLERGQGLSALKAGLLLTPIPLTTTIVAPLSGILSDRIGPRIPATLGAATMALALYLLADVSADMTYTALIWRLVVMGVGQGLFNSPNSSAVLGSVPRPRLGTASATLAQMRVNGQSIGIALGGAIVASRVVTHTQELQGKVAQNLVERDALILAIHDAFYVSAAVCVLAILTSLVRGRQQQAEAAEAAGHPAG
jgi:EmrB/QacA subfamily drug resistance transporter